MGPAVGDRAGEPHGDPDPVGLALTADGLSSSFVATRTGEAVVGGFLSSTSTSGCAFGDARPEPHLRHDRLRADGCARDEPGRAELRVAVLLIPPLLFRMNPAVMGPFVNKRATSLVLGAIGAVISLLNG